MANAQPAVQKSLTMDAVWKIYGRDIEAIESHIRQHLCSDPPLVNDVAEHILDGSGKRIRPLLLSLCSRLTGQAPADGLVMGSLIEFIHTATLLHDDVLDEAALRRGQPAARRIWGNQASILVGDYLYSKAMQHIAALENHGVNATMAAACRKMAEGEILQLAANRQPLIPEADYLRIIEYKTGALMAAACKIGAILAGASPMQQEGLYRFGLSLGMAFQLTDDRLDYTADDKRFGKTIGQDLMQGMATLPFIHLLQCLPGEDRRALTAAIGAGAVDEQQLLRITALMLQHGSLQYTMDCARQYIDTALRRLETFEDSTARHALAVVAEYMVNRNR